MTLDADPNDTAEVPEPGDSAVFSSASYGLGFRV